MNSIHITVHGRVQGVGFRWQTVKAANRYGIKGTVRNLPDGSVFIEAEGKKPALDAFTEWCRQGPDHAYVTKLDVTDGAVKGYKDFGIIY
jgi:acylphosphatase